MKSTKGEIKIRHLHSVAELEKARQLENIVWGEKESIPVHQTLTSSQNGGFLLGAFIDSKLVGFQYSFPGYDGNSIYLCSHILAVDPRYRNCGIGERLKNAQWEESQKRGYAFISWTFDPLESANGYLNIGKLGAECSEYMENCYGELDDYLNSNFPTDRFVVKWTNLKQKNPPEREKKERQVEKLNVVGFRLNEDGMPVIEQVKTFHPGQSNIAVAIPNAIQQIKEKAPQIALDWRLKTRELFTRLFNEGWELEDFMKGHNAHAVHYYILKMKEGTK